MPRTHPQKRAPRAHPIPPDEEILALDTVPVELAADYIGWTPMALRLALREKMIQIGSAVQMEGGRWSYNISPGLLVAYKRGTICFQDMETTRLLLMDAIGHLNRREPAS